MNLPNMSNEDAEYIIDQAINWLNRYGTSLSNMSGTAGSKTVSLTSQEEGVVFETARLVYYAFYKGVENVVVQGQTVSTPDIMSNPTVLRQIKEGAWLLRGRTFLRT